MRSELWSEANRVVQEALELPAVERGAFVERACSDRSDLRREALDLLAADASAGTFLERPAMRLASASLPLEGERIGAYRLGPVLGTGGMGQVYLGERVDGGFRQRVAIKILRADLATHPELRERFRIERQVLAELTHPHIARLLGGGVSRTGRSYLVMELVEGEPIDVYCDRHQLSTEKRLRLFLKVCAAVQHAHRYLVVHRDLKPANLLVTADGTPKLLDFGIAKLLDADRFGVTSMARTRTGRQPMTPLYASPEQVRGETCTTASDVYSLAVLLYCLLAGRAPYTLTEGHGHELERAILEQEPSRPSSALERTGSQSTADEVASVRGATVRELRRHLRGDLDTIVLTGLRKSPERRYTSVAQLTEDLERHLSSRPIRSRPETFSYRLSKLVQRRPIETLGSALAVLVLIAFTLILTVQAQRIVRERDAKEAERAKARQVSDLLLEIFSEADPYRASGQDLTLREVLSHGARKSEELVDQPDLQAAYLQTLGAAFHGRGFFDEARPLLERALILRRELHGHDHAETLETRQEVAALERNTGHYGKAETLYLNLLADLRERGSRDRDLAKALVGIGRTAQELGKLDMAENTYRELLDLYAELPDVRARDWGEAYNNLALVTHERGDLETTAELYRKTLIYWEDPKEHPGHSMVLNNLAGLHQDRGELDEAEGLFRRSLDLRREILGPEHPAVATVYNNLAYVAYERGKLDAAIEGFREAVRLAETSLGAGHPNAALFRSGLTRALYEQGEIDAAETEIRAALEVLRERLPEGHWRIAYAEILLGACLTQRGLFAEAEGLMAGRPAVIAQQIGDEELRARDAVKLMAEHEAARGLDTKAREQCALPCPNGSS